MDSIKNAAFIFFPQNNEWRERFIYSLFEWARKDNSLELYQFCMEYKLSRQTLYDWRDMYPDIKSAINEVKLMLASRRRTGALQKKFDKDVVFKDLHTMDPEWLAINKYHSDLKKEEDKQPTTFIIQAGKPEVQARLEATPVEEAPKEEE